MDPQLQQLRELFEEGYSLVSNEYYYPSNPNKKSPVIITLKKDEEEYSIILSSTQIAEAKEIIRHYDSNE